MKSINKTVLAAAVAASFTLAINTKADNQVFLSPKASQNQTQAAMVPDSSPNLVHAQDAVPGSPKMKSEQPVVLAATPQSDRDLVREQRQVVYTGKNPSRDSTQMRRFEIAPLK